MTALQKFADESPAMYGVLLCLSLFMACGLFYLIREFWCWYWKTSEIAEQLAATNAKLDVVAMKLSEANQHLERIARATSSASVQR